MHVRKCLINGICHRHRAILQRARLPMAALFSSMDFTVIHYRQKLLQFSNQHAFSRSLSIPPPPPIDLSKVQGPTNIVDVDLHEQATKITFVGEDERDRRIYIKRMNSVGFRLSNNLFAVGPIAIFPTFVLQWKVGRVDKIPPEAFAPFYLIEPKIDFLIVGYGDPEERIPMELRQALTQRRRFGFDFMPTEKAVGLYNFMVEEGRYCAGLFIPPIKIKFGDDDMFKEGERIMDIARHGKDWTYANRLV